MKSTLTHDEIYNALDEIGKRIEDCGASPALTRAVSLVSDLRRAFGNQHNAPDPYAADRVRKSVELSGRGCGKTRQQLLDAPKGAVYVWPDGNTSYPTELAKKLGREDLRIVSPMWLTSGAWRGRRFSAIITDHAYRPTGYALVSLLHARERVIAP